MLCTGTGFIWLTAHSSQLQGVQYMVSWSHGKNIMAEGHGGAKLLSSWQAEKETVLGRKE